MHKITDISYKPPIEQILYPFQEFVKLEASGGILLLLCTAVALIWANSPWSENYFALWQTKLTVGLSSFALSKPLLFWINDGLMAMFFFVVGLEIKRELLVGELSSPKQAALPIAAALGGMIVPAVLYLSLNAGKPGAPGWGIPMATDIAFVLGVLALLGKRVPVSLKVFLTSLAIVDDIGAVLVIAVFYTSAISWFHLAVGFGFLAALVAANRLGIRHTLIYAALGIGGLWFSFLLSGVHPTVAGVLAAMTIPAYSRIDKDQFLNKSRYLLGEFERAGAQGGNALTDEVQRESAEALEKASELVQAPLQRLEHYLHPWVIFGIMPLFAFANAGVSLSGDLSEVFTHPVTLGVAFGLILGKQLGITLFSWLAVRSGLAAIPSRVSWRQIYGAGWLGGIGFTMSIFIASLAFDDDPRILSIAKIGILTASLIAGASGFLILKKIGSASEGGRGI